MQTLQIIGSIQYAKTFDGVPLVYTAVGFFVFGYSYEYGGVRGAVRYGAVWVFSI